MLTDHQIALIRRWVEAGAPLGDSTKLPPSPTFPSGSMLGKPDLVVRMPKRYPIKGDNLDNFVTLKAPYSIPRDTFVRAIEFVPGNRTLVHHMNGHLITYPEGKRRDPFKGSEVYIESVDHNAEQLADLDVLNDDGSFPPIQISASNYLPGMEPTLYPEGIGGLRLTRKGAFILNQIHYGPSPVDTFDQSYFNIFYADAAPKRPLFEFILGTGGIVPPTPKLDIAPETKLTVRSQYTLPAAITIVNINPHMHLLGRRFLAYAVTPARDTIPLIRINDWDFRWQYFYTPEKAIPLPAGTTVHAEGLYDNTSANPRNPSRPPRRVIDHGGSMKTTDEMFQLIVSFMRHQPGDDTLKLGGARVR